MNQPCVTTRKSNQCYGDKNRGSVLVMGTMGDVIMSVEIPDGQEDTAVRAVNCATAMEILLANARHIILAKGVGKCRD